MRYFRALYFRARTFTGVGGGAANGPGGSGFFIIRFRRRARR
jgi:hypothetical protein